jgi:signal transduction histidine kinase
VDDLLDVASLTAGPIALRPTTVDLVALVMTQVMQVQELTEHHTLKPETPGRPLIGWWDPNRLGQVLANLLTNAIKYSPEGSDILCQVEDAGGEARVVVVDQGVGIAATALPQLFEPFYRTESEVARDVPGFGLGLYVTRMLVEAHGGRIAVESVLGQGSTSLWYCRTRGYRGSARSVPGRHRAAILHQARLRACLLKAGQPRQGGGGRRNVPAAPRVRCAGDDRSAGER